MRLLSMLLVSAAAITAQSPLTTTFANNNGGSTGGAVYFTLECTDPAGVSISDLDLNFQGAGGLAGSIDVYVKGGTWLPHTSAEYVLATSGTVLSSSAAGTPTNVVLATPLELGAGCSVGVAIVNTGLATAYTTATTLPPQYTTTELTLTVGGGSNTPFAGTAFQPRLVNTNIYYTAGGVCPSIPFPASAASVGTGCGQGPVTAIGSFYELAAAGALDLSGKKLVATNTGSGFEMSIEAGAGFAVGFGSTNLNLGDDASVAVGTLGMTVGSNGWMAQGAGNSTAFAPSVATMLGNPSTAVYSWTDLQPNAAGSGSVYYGESGGVATATFYQVYGWGATTENSIKIDIDTNTGDWSIEWGVVDGGPEDWLVGYSTGDCSRDPGTSDISAIVAESLVDCLAIAAADTFDPALGLEAIGTPLQGPAASAFDVTTTGIPAGALSHLGLLGLTNPNQDLTVLGLPGCFLYSDAVFLTFDILSGQTDFQWNGLNIPAGPGLNGFAFTLQSAIFGTAENSFLGLGALTSNGLECVIGDS